VWKLYDASRKYGEDESDAESLINYYPDDLDKGPTHVFEKEELKAILAEAVDGLSRKERLVVSLTTSKS
jgi:DNA-directed RNA polymerase specialized sigma subunit